MPGRNTKMIRAAVCSGPSQIEREKRVKRFSVTPQVFTFHTCAGSSVNQMLRAAGQYAEVSPMITSILSKQIGVQAIDTVYELWVQERLGANSPEFLFYAVRSGKTTITMTSAKLSRSQAVSALGRSKRGGLRLFIELQRGGDQQINVDFSREELEQMGLSKVTP